MFFQGSTRLHLRLVGSMPDANVQITFLATGRLFPRVGNGSHRNLLANEHFRQ